MTIVDMGNLPESHVSMSELAVLIHKWPLAVINHMTWRQRDIELMRKVAKIKFRQKHRRLARFVEQSLKLICIVMWLAAIWSWPNYGDAPCHGARWGGAHLKT